MPTIMAQEIAEQPAAIVTTLEALRPLRPRIAQLAQNCQQILFVARGSSDNAAVLRSLPARGARGTDRLPGGAERGDALSP